LQLCYVCTADHVTAQHSTVHHVTAQQHMTQHIGSSSSHSSSRRRIRKSAAPGVGRLSQQTHANHTRSHRRRLLLPVSMLGGTPVWVVAVRCRSLRQMCTYQCDGLLSSAWSQTRRRVCDEAQPAKPSYCCVLTCLCVLCRPSQHASSEATAYIVSDSRTPA
jgi:hypothetical protein